MPIREQIRELTDEERFLEFYDFVHSGVKEGELPDYESLDPTTVSGLVPNIFVHDFRKGTEDGFYIKFSGTKIDEHYGQVVQGKYFQDVFTGDDRERYFPLYLEAIESGKPFFVKREVHYDEGKVIDKHLLSTILFFPCSSDGTDVNFGIGMAHYTHEDVFPAPVYLLLGD